MRKRYIAGFGFSALAALGLPFANAATASAAPLPAHVQASSGATYTVQSGDSLWTIAHAHNVDWFNLAADNGLQMYTTIYPGEQLHLPLPGEAPHSPLPLTPPAATTAAPVATAPAAATSTDATPGDETSESAPAPAAPAPAPAAPAAQSSGTVSSSGMSSFEQCVIARESGGNPDVTNSTGHWGLFQFSPSTWAAYGGNPADFGSASAAEQQQVFNNAIAQGGQSNWAPYDGC